MLNRAHVYTALKYASQKRARGDTHCSHPVEVAWLISDLESASACRRYPLPEPVGQFVFVELSGGEGDEGCCHFGIAG